MAESLSLSISSALDATIAELDLLLVREANSRTADFARLQLAVAGLDVASPAEPEPDAQRQSGEASRPMQAATEPAPTPYVHLPERTTHGGPWGPKMRAKLIAEALR